MLYNSITVIFLCSFQLINTEASTIPSGNKNSQYNCLGYFECPATNHDVVFPLGNLTSGYNFSRQYFEDVCQYSGELADCTLGKNVDYTECGYVESVMFGYRQFYFTQCSSKSTLKSRLVQLIPCMNSHALQLDIIGLINKLIGKLELIFTWPTSYNKTDTTLRDASCRSVYEFTEGASHLAKEVCGDEYADIIYILMEAVASVTEKTLGLGCDDIM